MLNCPIANNVIHVNNRVNGSNSAWFQLDLPAQIVYI